MLPALLAVWCTVTIPRPAMSLRSTRATPSGSDMSAATPFNTGSEVTMKIFSP